MEKIFFIVLVGYLILVSILDMITKETPYFISFPFLLIGFFSNILLFLNNFSIFLVINILLAFLISYFKYRYGLWGGGDLLMFIGVSFYLNLIFPTIKFSIIYFLFFMYIATLFYNTSYVLFYYFKEKLMSKYELILIFLLIITFFLNKTFFIFLLLIYLMIIVNKVDLFIFTKKVDIDDLKEEDWIAFPVYKNNKKILDPKDVKEGITKEIIRDLKKKGVKSVYIKEVVPYLPTFLIGFLLMYWFFNYFSLFFLFFI